MTLFQFSEAVETHWKTSEELDKFFRSNPKFKDAEIVQEGLIEYNFPTDYDYSASECWVVNLDGKLYNILISEGNWYNRRVKKGVMVKRYYPVGTPKRTRTVKNDWDFEYKRPWEFVVRNQGEKKNNDCQIWTIAVCLGVSYSESYDLLYAKGWREEKPRNERLNDWKGIFASKGKTYEEYWNKWKPESKQMFKGSTVGNIASKLPKEGTFAISTKNHVFAVVDGVIIDSCFRSGDHVSTVHKIS